MPVLPFYQVDAFASRAFEGNQACIMPLDAFLVDDAMLAIAAEKQCGGNGLYRSHRRSELGPAVVHSGR